jgi:uncharacterized protein YbjQ (UPF0145 family)
LHGVSTAIGATGESVEGPILVTASAIPADIEHQVLGTVQVDTKVGLDSVASLYPSLAAEARKLGANAVVNVKGGRRVTLFSWAAAYVGGTAVKIEDPQRLKELSGTYH